MEQDRFVKYIEELHDSLFGEMSVEEILQSYKNSHRKSRYIAQMILKDKETFYKLQEPDYGLEDIYKKVLSALFHQERHRNLKQQFINLLDVTECMITAPASLHEILEIDKDFSNFELWMSKK